MLQRREQCVVKKRMSIEQPVGCGRNPEARKSVDERNPVEMTVEEGGRREDVR